MESLVRSSVDVEGRKSRRNETASATWDRLNLVRILGDLKKCRKMEKPSQTVFDTGVSGVLKGQVVKKRAYDRRVGWFCVIDPPFDTVQERRPSRFAK